MPEAAVKELDAYLSGKRIEALWSQIGVGLAAATINTMLLGFLFVPYVGWGAYLGWVAAMVIAYDLRNIFLYRIRLNQSKSEHVERTLVFSSAMLGFVINIPAAFFLPHMAPEVGGLYVAIAVGWVAVAVVIIGIQPLAYLLYTIIGLSMIGIGFWQFLPTNAAWVSTGTLVIAGVMLVAFARTIASNFEEKAAYDLEKEERNRELEGLNHELEELNEKLKYLDEKRAAFVSGYAHDLKQPVHGLDLHVELLQRTSDPEVRAKAIETISKSTARIRSMIEGLADQESLERGEVRPDLKLETVSRILDEVDADHRETCEAKGVAFSVSCEDNVFAYADPLLLGRVLSNLVDNAVKYTSQGSVRVEVKSQPEGVEIAVTDTGIGIAPNDRTRVKKAFERGVNQGEDTKGQGLGLALALQYTELMNGALTIEDSDGPGSKVIVFLPRPDDARNASRAGRGDAAKRLLIVDDDVTSMEGLSMGLELEHVEHRCFTSLQEALDALDGNGFVPSHLVIDFNLGEGANGIEAISQLRQRLGRVPAMIITGEKGLDREYVPKDVGLLFKPFKVERLVDAVDHL